MRCGLVRLRGAASAADPPRDALRNFLGNYPAKKWQIKGAPLLLPNIKGETASNTDGRPHLRSEDYQSQPIDRIILH
jgi:hypothetical protein